MTANQFRRIALSLPHVEERAHMEHPDFRVGGKIFATLGHPEKAWGMVKLLPERQRRYMQAHPAVFTPARGAWGPQGSTLVRLKIAAAVEEALTEAWLAKAPKGVANRSGQG